MGRYPYRYRPSAVYRWSAGMSLGIAFAFLALAFGHRVFYGGF